MVVGGLTNNILAPQYVEKQHAEKVNWFDFFHILVQCKAPQYVEKRPAEKVNIYCF